MKYIDSVFELIVGIDDSVKLEPMYCSDPEFFDDPAYEGREFVVLGVYQPRSHKDIEEVTNVR